MGLIHRLTTAGDGSTVDAGRLGVAATTTDGHGDDDYADNDKQKDEDDDHW